MTLTEVLVATALAALVVIGLGTMDASRSRMQEDLRSRAGAMVAQTLPALSLVEVAKSLERADRIVILDSGIDGVNPNAAAGTGDGKHKVRYVQCPTSPPDPTCFGDADNYRWEELRLRSGNLERLSNGCGTTEILADQIASLTFRYKDEAATPPPGGEPFDPPDLSDNNAIEYAVTWSEGSRTHTFRGEAIGRAIPYSDVNATLNASIGDSGLGLAPAGISPPPSTCPMT
ncbi:MAG: hypothetical protein HYW10_04150 [Candidatus Omnitrophica bacterium]|nr:hypothetical protein [Candidatus Omnitrophota bacterium]